MTPTEIMGTGQVSSGKDKYLFQIFTIGDPRLVNNGLPLYWVYIIIKGAPFYYFELNKGHGYG